MAKPIWNHDYSSEEQKIEEAFHVEGECHFVESKFGHCLEMNDSRYIPLTTSDGDICALLKVEYHPSWKVFELWPPDYTPHRESDYECDFYFYVDGSFESSGLDAKFDDTQIRTLFAKGFYNMGMINDRLREELSVSAHEELLWSIEHIEWLTDTQNRSYRRCSKEST